MGYSDVTFPAETKFLVTGGAGFIGANIVEVLLNKGCKVRVLDNLSTGKLSHLTPWIQNENLEVVIGDIRNLELCLKSCEDIDYVLHQAAWGSVPRSIKLPLEYEAINIKGTLNMLMAAKEKRVKRFVYASSSSVYGDYPSLPKEESRIGTPLSPYALTKRVNELYAHIFFKLYGLETIGLRYFNVFGKKQDPDSEYSAVIPRFIRLLMHNEVPTIYGDGTFSRDFTYVANVVEANLKACLAPLEAAGEVFNIAYGGQITLNELYDTLKSLLSKDIMPVYSEARTGDIPHSYADINKARQLLHYDPSFSFHDGIIKTIDWYKSVLSF